jgi:hypothetical protein
MPKTEVAYITIYCETRSDREPLGPFENAGHGYLSEAEDEANRVVLDFLERPPIPPVG